MKTVLVAGSARGLNEEAKRATRFVGAGLARHGFGLITGAWRGVDEETATAYLRELRAAGLDPVGRYLQVHDRRGWHPLTGFDVADRRLRLDVEGDEASYRECVDRCQAGILIGGLGGTKRVAFELIGSGRPVFPLPLTGGDALEAYAEILESWDEQSVHGLTRQQFLGLSLPLRRDAEELMRLLKAALADRIDVFVSYRRKDLPGAAGRIAADLVEGLGPRRVFLDTQGIRPGSEFTRQIRRALEECRVLVCLIGPRWDPGRTRERDDYVREEIEAALEADKGVLPVVAFGGRLPEREELPSELFGLLSRQAVFIESNATWEHGMTLVADEIDRILGSVTAVPPSERETEGSSS